MFQGVLKFLQGKSASESKVGDANAVTSVSTNILMNVSTNPITTPPTMVSGKSSTSVSATSTSLSPMKKNTWYQDRYEKVRFERNILMVLIVICSVGIAIATFMVGKIATSKTFSPFVIQIEEKTGVAKIVNPANSDILSGNEALARYFIKKYITARETYNPVDFEYNTKNVVRLFSSPQIYREFLSFIKNPLNDPTILYAQKNSTYLRVKSITKIDETYFVRFSLIETVGAEREFDRVATMVFQYVATELKDEERDINPVGFQVTGYKVEDDRG